MINMFVLPAPPGGPPLPRPLQRFLSGPGGPIISDGGLRPPGPISLGPCIPGGGPRRAGRLGPPLISRGGPIFSEPGGGPIGDTGRARGLLGGRIGGAGGSGTGDADSLAFKISKK